jgi:prepilin-type N-terminal cleavage/methylation domain-containing protein/prepilin-type processing-associated H-X9-DG protein
MKTSTSRKSAFTLLELLVVIAIIAVLAAIAVPVLANSAKGARQAAEIAAARSVASAMQMHSADNSGAILPGFYVGPGETVTDNDSNPIDGQPAKRYPWRLAPYLGCDVETAFLASGQKISDPSQRQYLVSLIPSLGMNTVYIGGDDRKAPNPFNPRLAPRFTEQGGVTRMVQVHKPSHLIAFVSAVYNDSRMGGEQPGYFGVEYPDRNVDFRHADGKALVLFLDGHTELLGRQHLRDERLWKNLPDSNFAMQ